MDEQGWLNLTRPTGVQRWRDRRASYRRPDEQIRSCEYDVCPIPDDRTARAFIEQHHYSGSFPPACERYGLWHRSELVGVAVLGTPMHPRVTAPVFPGVPFREVLELSRFVLLDQVPGNAETWMLARVWELLRRDGVAGCVSFSDPHPRTTAEGSVIFPGHLGIIYQAHNGVYVGRGTRRTLALLPDGRVLSARTQQKIRKAERGWRGAVRILVTQYGARPLAVTATRGDRLGWLREVRRTLCRNLRHPGNHKYAWPLARRLRVALPSLPYPKRAA
jgi:hypothetical protein